MSTTEEKLHRTMEALERSAAERDALKKELDDLALAVGLAERPEGQSGVHRMTGEEMAEAWLSDRKERDDTNEFLASKMPPCALCGSQYAVVSDLKVYCPDCNAEAPLSLIFDVAAEKGRAEADALRARVAELEQALEAHEEAEPMRLHEVGDCDFDTQGGQRECLRCVAGAMARAALKRSGQ